MTTLHPTPTTASTHHGVTHPTVRPFLFLDATLTGANGLAYLVLADQLSAWFGAPAALQRGLGVFLLVVAAGVAVLAVRRPVSRRGLRALVLLNALWVLASLGYALVGDLTAAGRAWVGLQAVMVGAFAAVQLWFVRRG